MLPLPIGATVSVRLSEVGCGEGWAAGDVRLGFPDEDILVFH